MAIRKNYFSSRESLTDAFSTGKGDEGDYRKSPGPEDDMLLAGAHQRPSGIIIKGFFLGKHI